MTGRGGPIAAGAVLAALIGAAPAAAECEIAIAFHNAGEAPLTLIPSASRTRTQLGRWRILWPDVEPVEIAPDSVEVLRWSSPRCQPADPRAFEFYLDAAPCTPPGLPQPVRSRLDATPGPDPDWMLAVRAPETGFRALPAEAAGEAGAPIPVPDEDLQPFDPAGQMRLEGPDLAAACAAARAG